MEQIRIAGRMRKYINSAMMRNTAGTVGLSPHLTANVSCIDEDSGEQRIYSSGESVTQKVIVTDVNKHLSYKAERIKKWMSCEGLEDERKWMTDTESVFGASLLSPFCQDTAHGRDLRERVIRGDVEAARGTVPRQFWPVLEAARADPKVIIDTR
jgi:hypothetical protein